MAAHYEKQAEPRPERQPNLLLVAAPHLSLVAYARAHRGDLLGNQGVDIRMLEKLQDARTITREWFVM